MANRNTAPGVEMENVNAGRLANAVTLSGTQTWFIPVHQLDNIDIEITTTGTATAALTVLMGSSRRISQGVNSSPTVIQAGTFTEITANALTKYPNVTRYGTDPAGAPAFNRFTIFQCPSQWIEISSVLASGAGTITIYYCAKGF